MERIEELAQETYEFLGNVELDAGFVHNFDEVYEALLVLGLSHSQVESITDRKSTRLNSSH